MRERNRRAREYSRLCRTRRWCRRMWVVAIVLRVMLLVLVAWCLTLPPAQEDVVQSPPTREVVEPEAENVLVCDITGYCACCTPYAHMNQRDGKVLTASGLWVDIGEAVAVDPDIIPLGSTVTLGGKTYIAADTGVYGYTVDVLMSHEDAAQAGVVKALVNRTAPPCKGCQRRHERCHGECEDYKAFRRDVEADKAKRYASYSEADFYSMNSARRENAKKAIRKRDGR